MALTPDFYIPDVPPPDPGGDGDIDIDPVALARLKSELRLAAEELENQRFDDVQLDDLAFGACPSGVELSAEHRTAHAIIADTITGVVADLWGYRDGVAQFEAGMGTADATAAADLQARQTAVEALQVSARSNHGESRYHQAQVHHLPAGADAAGGGQGGAADTGADAGQGDD